MTRTTRPLVARPLVVVVVALVALGALGACTRRDDGLGVFAGGFDPTRYDGGVLPDAKLDRPLRFDVPPFYADKIAEGAARDLTKYLEDETHLQIALQSPAAYDYAAISDGLAKGDVDVAELSPYQYALVEQRGIAIVPLVASVAHGASSYGSYLVVRQGSAIHSIDDIKGRSIAFVDPLSTSGYLLPALFLQQHGIDLAKDVHVRFAGSHPAALELVKSGAVDVAAVSSDLLIGNAGLAGPLVVIAKAGRMPYDVIVARGDLDAATTALVKRALLRLSIHDERGRAALRAFSSVDGFMPIPPGHYDGVRALAKRARDVALSTSAGQKP